MNRGVEERGEEKEDVTDLDIRTNKTL